MGESRQEIADIVKRAIAGLDGDVQQSMSVSTDIINHALQLKRQDDDKIEAWQNCHWYELCWAGPKPIRQVLKHVVDDALALKMGLTAWESQLSSITSCVRYSLDGGCDKNLIVMKMGLARKDFQTLRHAWATLKE